MKSFLTHDLEIAYIPWVTKFVHLQFLRLGTFCLGTFPLGVSLEGNGDFAVYQPQISVAFCTGRHSGVWYVSRVMLPSSLGGASVWSLNVSILPWTALLLEPMLVMTS